MDVLEKALNAAVNIALEGISLRTKDVRSVPTMIEKVPYVGRAHLLEEPPAFILCALFFFLFLGLSLAFLPLSQVILDNFSHLINRFTLEAIKHDVVFHILDNMGINMAQFLRCAQPLLSS
jgi:hypothetical protein